MSAKAVRLFVSSPGDVCAERTIADRVIRKLQKEYQGSLNLIPVLWEDLPLTAHGTFQEEINAALAEAPVDIAIFILGGRLGSSPGKNFLRPDGTPYASGTEYEFDLMMGSYRRLGRPEILVYRKKVSPAQMLATDAGIADVSEAVRQMQDLENFVEERFHDKEKGAYIAYHRVDDALTFENRLTEHLRGLLSKVNSAGRRKLWQGNPYKGLLSFEQEDEAIFFGRSNALNQLEKPLWDQLARNEMPLVFVCGGSGSGKSSLVKAGLVPDLVKSSVLQKTKVCPRIVTPQQWKGSLCDGLWGELRQMFLRLPAMPSPANADFVGAVADLMRMASDLQIKENTIRTVPLIVIDQFEETFTDSRRTQEDVRGFAFLLQAVRRSGRVIVAATLRNDFYHYLTDREEWLELRQAALVWDIPRMSASEFAQVIAEPAAMAGLEWEREEQTGKPLNEVILDDAISTGLPLPLLEFALAVLVDASDDVSLTYKGYRELGGLQGAVQRQADRLFATFSSSQRQSFFDLLEMVVSVDPSSGAFVRREMPLSDLELDADGSYVLQTLLSNRLFRTARQGDGNPVVSIAHEQLLSSWTAVARYLHDEHQAIESLNEIRLSARRWGQNGKDCALLLDGLQNIVLAEILLKFKSMSIDREMIGYLRASLARWTHRKLPAILLGLFVSGLFLMVMLSAWTTGRIAFSAVMCGGAAVVMMLEVAITSWTWEDRADGLRVSLGVLFVLAIFEALSLWLQWNRGFRLTVLLDGFVVVLMVCDGLIVARDLRYVRDGSDWRARFDVMATTLRRRSSELIRGVFVGALFLILALCALSIWNDRFRDLESSVEGLYYDIVRDPYAVARKISSLHSDWDFRYAEEKRKSFGGFLHACYELGYYDDILEGLPKIGQKGEYERAQLAWKVWRDLWQLDCAYEEIVDCRKFDQNLKFRCALFAGRLEDARKWFRRGGGPLLDPPNERMIDFAHGLVLCDGDMATAKRYYALACMNHGLCGRVRADFAMLKCIPEFRSVIASMEKDFPFEPLAWKWKSDEDVMGTLSWLSGTWWHVTGVGEDFRLSVDSSAGIQARCSVLDTVTGKEKRMKFLLVKMYKENGWYLVEAYDARNGECETIKLLRKGDNEIELHRIDGNSRDWGCRRFYREKPSVSS